MPEELETHESAAPETVNGEGQVVAPPTAGSSQPAAVQVSDENALEALIAVYKAQPGIVAEVVGGSTVAEVKASLGAAKAAYDAAKTSVLKEQQAAVPSAPAQGAAPEPTTGYGLIRAAIASGE